MRKTSELIWELAIALIAFAGAFTLVSSFFPSIPAYVFGSLFLLAFLFMLVSFSWRIYESRHPVKIIVADMTINTCDKPRLDIIVGFFTHEKTYIEAFSEIKFESQLDNQLKTIAKFYSSCHFKTPDSKNTIQLETNGYIEVQGTIPISIREGYSKDDFEAVEFVNKVKLGWKEIGHKMAWAKMSCHYATTLPELAARYPTMVKKPKHAEATTKKTIGKTEWQN